jgi:hypothetical protein
MSKEMTMDEMDQVNAGVVLLVIVAAWKPSPARKGNSTRFLGYTEEKSPFKVEIHKSTFRNERIGYPPEPE